MSEIKLALEPEPEIVVINPNLTKKTTKSYKYCASPISQNTENPLNFDNFKQIQKFILKVHTNQITILGLYIGVHAYFNQKIVYSKETTFCNGGDEFPCKIKFLFRKACLDLEQFKPTIFEDIAISIKNLLDYGCLDSVLIPPSEKFEGFNPTINDAINLIQAEIMSHLTLKITTCPNNFLPQNYPTHGIKLLTKNHQDYPILFNDGFESWDVQGNTHYQHNLLRAQTQGYRWFFTTTMKENSIL